MMNENKQSMYNMVGLMMVVAVGVAMAAGGDTTFGDATTGPLGTLTGWLTGSMGKIFAIGALATGLGVGIVKQSVMSVAVGVGIALAASAGPAVLDAVFAAAM